MSYVTRRMRHRPIDVWPGYVDALSTLLMMIALVLLLLLVAQFYLTDAVSHRDVALGELNARLRSLTAALGTEKAEGARLRGELSEAERKRQETGAMLAERTQAGEVLASEITELNRRLAELTSQLGVLTADLDTSRQVVAERDTALGDLKAKLDAALASRVSELAEYRSEFFGRLKKVLGNRPDIQIVGDRFVFQSEVFFASGSAELSDAGKAKLKQLAEELKKIASDIPKDIGWILTVIGHTDRVPIATPLFRSNWELSSGRAISVVKYLIEQGIPPERLSATGYGEFQPIDSGSSPESFARNRRIELKFTQR